MALSEKGVIQWPRAAGVGLCWQVEVGLPQEIRPSSLALISHQGHEQSPRQVGMSVATIGLPPGLAASRGSYN